MMGAPDIDTDPDGFARSRGFRNYEQMRAYMMARQAGPHASASGPQPSPTQAPAPPPAQPRTARTLGGVWEAMTRALGY